MCGGQGVGEVPERFNTNRAEGFFSKIPLSTEVTGRDSSVYDTCYVTNPN